VPRAELVAVVAERNRWKDKHRALEAQLAELESKIPSDDQLRSFEKAREDAETLAADNERLTTSLAHEKSDLEKRLEHTRELAAGLAVEGAVADAAARLDAFRPQLVAKLLADRFRADMDGDITRVIPLAPDGSDAVREDGKPVSVQEAVAAFMVENDFLVRSSNLGGAGSAATPAQKNVSVVSPGDIAGMTSTQRKALLREKFGGGPPSFRW